MIIDIGFGALVITLIVSLFGIFAALYGERKKETAWVESARLSMLLTFPLLTLASICLIIALVTGKYEVTYVASVTSDSMPVYLKITALWGGQAGSLLFWSWLLALFTSAVTLRKWDRDREFLPWVIVVSLFTLVFFLALIIFFENPFNRLWQLPNGQIVEAMFAPGGGRMVEAVPQGLNPLLRHPGMIIHPPMLYLGFVAFIIPYAFAIAAMITRRSDDRWIRLTRRWSLIAWLFLSLGLILGARWAYDVLGWGGYWGWDPVEIAAFMPWLTGTAFLHSVMIQEKRGMMKHWNMILIILTYSLVIFGTFLTRSGVLSSVHSFAQSAIGPMFFAFIGITFIFSLSLLISRWDTLKSESHLNSLLSREAFFLLNNLLFILILFVCFLGVIFPLASEIITGEKITVGPEWYERITGPMFGGLLLLMGVAPLSAWGHSTIVTLGRAIWKPLLVSILGPVIAFFTGLRQPSALLAFWILSLAVCIIVYEFWRGVIARQRRFGENKLVAFALLVGRNRRRYGGYIIHFGVVFMALGVIGIEIFQSETQNSLNIGDTISLEGYDVKFESLSIFDKDDGRNIARAEVSVSRNGSDLGMLFPRRDYYYESRQPMTIPGVRSTMEGDLYVLLVDWEPISAAGATFKIYHNPLVGWLWWGAAVFIAGTFIAAWPTSEEQRLIRRSRSSSYSPAKA